MTARTRWTLIIALFLIGNIAGVSVLIGFSRGDMDRRLVPGYEHDQHMKPPAAPAPDRTSAPVHTAALGKAAP